MINLLQALKSAGVPIDGVGFEAHVYEVGDQINGAVLSEHMQQLARMGLKARISEIDVHGESPQVQSQQYGAVWSACLSNNNCSAFSTWGITDLYGSTTTDHTYPAEYGDDLLWNDHYVPKLAQTNLLELNR